MNGGENHHICILIPRKDLAPARVGFVHDLLGISVLSQQPLRGLKQIRVLLESSAQDLQLVDEVGDQERIVNSVRFLNQ